MSTLIRLESSDSLVKVEAALAQTACDGSHEAVIRKTTNKRSDAQNALLWVWHREWGGFYGIDESRAHDEFKWLFVRPVISARDGEYAALVDLAKARGLAKTVASMTSSTDLKVKEMAGALDKYQRYVAKRGCVLSTNNEHYEKAMGKK